MKTVLYIVKSQLHIYPPCVTQIRLLNSAGIEVEVLFGSCSDVVKDIFDNDGIKYKELKDPRGRFRGAIDKLNNYIVFRRCLIKELNKRDLRNTVIWFGNAETLLSMKGALSGINYSITFLELLDDHPLRMRLLKSMANHSLFNISCEETRAYIMKAWWKLEKLPYVMPNKPFDNPIKFGDVTDPAAKSILDAIGNKKIILFQGLIKEMEILLNFVKAIEKLGDEYVFLLMGTDRESIIPRLKAVSKRVYSGWVTAPNHLQITSKAFIGIVFYDGDYCLNNAFCAPNKIYEYGAFGVPMIANNIPGLKNTVGIAGAAFCCDLSVDSIVEGINSISACYDNMRESAFDFYRATDLSKIMNIIIKDNLL